jgi:hypothetical protein
LHLPIPPLGWLVTLTYYRTTAKTDVLAIAATPDSGHLKPTQNQTNANRRPADIMYSKISSDLHFDTIDANNTASYPFSFFVRLPIETITVQNSTDNDVTLNTFHGADAWHETADQAASNFIWDHPRSFRKPCVLLPPHISETTADAVIENHSYALEKIALEAAWHFVTPKVYDQLCPNVAKDPGTVIQGIHQNTLNSDGASIVLSVESYFTAVQRMTNFLPKDRVWGFDVVQHFITHL